MNEKTKLICIIIGVILVCCTIYYLFGLHDNRGRTDSIGQQLDSVSDSQQSAIDHIGNIETGLADSAATVDRVAESVGGTVKEISTVEERITTDQGRLRTSSEIITDCQRILEEVRERGQE